MPGEDALEGGQGSGKDFREKFESTMTENSVLRDKLATVVAGGFQFVEASDLQDVPVDELEAKAAELQEARTGERQSILADELQRRGLSEEQIQQVLAGETTGTQSAASPLQTMGSISGTPLSQRPSVDADAAPKDKLRAGLAAKHQKR